MIQGLFFNILYFMLALMHRIWAKVQGLRAFRKHKSMDQRFQNHMHVGHSNSHQFGMFFSKLFSQALCLDHAFLRKVIPFVDRSQHLRFDALTWSVSGLQALGWRSKVQVKIFKIIVDKSHRCSTVHRYDVISWMNYRTEALLTIWR